LRDGTLPDGAVWGIGEGERKNKPMQGNAMDWTRHYASRAAHMGASEIRELLKLLDQPDIISFAGGIPDPALFPQAAIARAYAEIAADPRHAAAALQYSASEGYAPLREWIAAYMGAKGVACDAGNVLITSGSQQALDFLGKLFVSPGDEVLVSRPTYLGALQAVRAYEPSFAELPKRGDNLQPRAGLARRAFGYVMPDFENPTGICLTRAEREALLDTAAAWDVPLIEDAAYEALRYEGESVPSLLALDCARSGGIEAARVIYCGTFSKTVVPGLRLGWIVAPSEVIHRLVLIKQASDLHSPTLTQMVMHRVVREHLPHGVEAIRDAYRGRRDAMLAALARAMPKGVTWTRPEGGMFIWVTLPAGMDAGKLLKRAIAEVRVAYVPGQAFHDDGTGTNTLRLSFSLSDENRIATGIGRLGELVARAMG
jgi:DNA-binding transcriptional MocR family regulator